MASSNDSDKNVKITIDEDKSNESVPVTPVVPDVVSQSKDEGRPPKSNSNSRGRQLKPETPGSRSRSNSRSPNRRARRDIATAHNDAAPLLSTDEVNLPRQKPPMAGPEMDNDEPDEDRNYGSNDNRGIDDGFLSGGPNSTEIGRRTPDRRNSNPPPFPYDPEYGPNLPPGVITTTNGTRVIPDMNVYQQKKSLAQGMMDLALLSANANQLRYVLESNTRHPYFYVSLVFISTSIICQVAVGIGLIWKSRYNIKRQDDFCKADRINNMVTIGIFIITLVNVLISAFGVAEPARVG
ncbi:ninjurin-A-like [Malaya genurostris]|uniref:ninjurin-A-like n=1 Tax=Malaya genurostris TaxID=325434 RepID=UPI0026F3B45A|nr:ninjurin-A-like [Malaya genurostris]